MTSRRCLLLKERASAVAHFLCVDDASIKVTFRLFKCFFTWFLLLWRWEMNSFGFMEQFGLESLHIYGMHVFVGFFKFLVFFSSLSLHH